jgi:hypothetical protein
MRGFFTIAGLTLALTLVALGLLLLPEPGFGSVPAVFTALWLLVALASALAFGKELWRREKLKAYRKHWRSGKRRGVWKTGSRRRALTGQARFTLMAERERRLD